MAVLVRAYAYGVYVWSTTMEHEPFIDSSKCIITGVQNELR